jgi:hypothetical protein
MNMTRNMIKRYYIAFFDRSCFLHYRVTIPQAGGRMALQTYVAGGIDRPERLTAVTKT